jgi:MscS family membrane protein
MKNLSLICILAALTFHTVAGAPRPLEPLDASSPRATLSQFLEAVDEIGRAAVVYHNGPSRDNFLKVVRAFQPPRKCFDLSGYPETSRREHSGEAIVLLWEVLSRIELPPLGEVPDRAAMRERVAKGEPDSWSIPHTEITLVRIKEGEQAGEYLFSGSSVQRLPQFYRRVEKLPYVRAMAIDHPRQLHKLWAGWYIPPAVVESMPGWLIAEIGDQVIWKWLAVILLLAILLFATWKMHRWAGLVTREHSFGRYLRPLVAPGTFLLLMPLVEYLVRVQVNITGVATDLFQALFPALTYLAMAWLTWQTSLFTAEAIISSPRIPDQGLNAHLLRLVARVVGLVGVLIVLFWGGNRLGLPLYGLIAGVSVGGLAIALAAQGTLENFLGSINLFADRPVRIGDFCRYGSELGTVEEIGLRSTRLRGADRTVTTVPNSDFSKMQITNFSRRDRMLLKTVIGLRYETTPDQLRHLLTRMRELLVAHPQIINDPLRVRFVGFGDSSLNVEIYAFVRTRDMSEFLGVQEDIFLRVIDLVEASGTGFAFPSQTLYLSRDSGLDAERRKVAEAEVKTWREEEKLQFPNLDPEQIKSLQDTLEWPPVGSKRAESGKEGQSTRPSHPVTHRA